MVLCLNCFVVYRLYCDVIIAPTALLDYHVGAQEKEVIEYFNFFSRPSTC